MGRLFFSLPYKSPAFLCVEFCICRADAASNGFYDRHGHAVASLLVCLCIGVDGEELVDLILGEALQAETLSRHQSSDSAAAHDNAVRICGVHCMGDARKHTPTARIAAHEAEINGIAFVRFLIAFLGRFLNVEDARILPFEIRNRTILLRIQASGIRRDLRITLRQIYEVEPGLSAGVLCAGESGRIIDSFSQPSMDDLYKSFRICSKDRKYFSGASGIKISDKEQPAS